MSNKNEKVELHLVGEQALLDAIWPPQHLKAVMKDGKPVLNKDGSPRLAGRPSHRTLVNWRLDGSIPYVRIGLEVYYNLPEVAEAIKERWTVRSGRRGRVKKAGKAKAAEVGGHP